jgi:hypothetical protein
MSSALKQVLINAIVKVAGQNPARDIPGEPTAEQARDSFIQLLIAELFPENPSVPAIKEKKKPGPKPKLDENGNPIRKTKSPKTVSPDSLASSPAKEKKKPGPKPKLDENGEPIKKAKSPTSSEPKEKKPRAPMSDEAKAAMAAKRKATLEAKKAAEPTKTPEKEVKSPKTPKAPKKAKKEKAEESPKKTPKKEAKAESPKKSPAKEEEKPKKEKAKKEAKAESPKKEAKAEKEKKPKSPKKAEATVNIDKFLPTQKKKVKEIVGEAVDVKDVLSYLNGLSNAAFNDKPLLDHVRDYAASLKPAEEETQTEEVELQEVEFDGETYAVNPETKRVYTVDEVGNATGVGYVGMGKFEAMELEEDDE